MPHVLSRQVVQSVSGQTHNTLVIDYVVDTLLEYEIVCGCPALGTAAHSLTSPCQVRFYLVSRDLNLGYRPNRVSLRSLDTRVLPSQA